MLLLHMQIRRYFNKICDNNCELIWDPSVYNVPLLTTTCIEVLINIYLLYIKTICLISILEKKTCISERTLYLVLDKLKHIIIWFMFLLYFIYSHLLRMLHYSCVESLILLFVCCDRRSCEFMFSLYKK